MGGELPGKVALAEETGEGAHRRVEAGRGGGDGVVAENHRLAVERLLCSQPAANLGRFLRTAGGAANGQQLGDAELGVDVLAQAVEVPVVAEEMGEAAAGGGVGGLEVGGKRAVRGFAGEEPFERQSRIELEELAQTEGEEAVAHEGGIADGNAVVREIAAQAAAAGLDAFGAGRGFAVVVAAVEGRAEIGQARAESQPHAERARRNRAIGFQLLRGRGAAEGRALGMRRAEAAAAAEFAEDGGAGLGGEEADEGGRRDAEDGRKEGKADCPVAAAEGGIGGVEDGLGVVGGVAEDVFHGGRRMAEKGYVVNTFVFSNDGGTSGGWSGGRWGDQT